MTQQDEKSKIVAKALSLSREREKGYREKALKMFPWVCGKCGREFSGKRVRELTVHHKDHNHDYNPPDGSNWELLCIYCHEDEHSRYESAADYESSDSGGGSDFSDSPFANLGEMLQKKKG